MQLHTLLCVIDVKAAYIINKPTLVGEHVFSTDGGCWLDGSRYNIIHTQQQ